MIHRRQFLNFASCAALAGVSPALAATRPSIKLADYGVFPNQDTDQSRGIQAAINAVSARGAGTLWFENGTYVCKLIYLKPGVSLAGQGNGTIIKKAAPWGKWDRVITCRKEDFPFEEDHGRGVSVRNLVIDGSWEAGTGDPIALEQAHCLFLFGNPAHAGRLRAHVSNVHFQHNSGDGLHCYQNVSLTADNITARDCYRGGLTSTGGNCHMNVSNLTVDESGIDLEPNTTGLLPSVLNVNNLICAGNLDIAVTGESVVNITNLAMTGINWNVYCGSTGSVTFNGGRLIAGAADGKKNRLNYPGNVVFNGTELLVAHNPEEPNRDLYCCNIYTQKDPGNQRVWFNNCTFGIWGELPEKFSKKVHAIYAQGSDFDLDNWIIVNGGGCEDGRFDQFVHMHIGPKCQIGGGLRCGAKQFGYFNYRSTSNNRGHFIIGDVVFGETCQEYANLGSPAGAADLAIFDHRGTVVPERLNVLSTLNGHQPPDGFFRGGRTIRGTKSFPDNTPGLKGDTYDNGASKWRCTASHLTAATWEAI